MTDSAARPASLASTSRTRAWLLAARPATLPAAISPVLVGLGVALDGGIFRPFIAIGCLGVAVLLQVAANLANDLFDFRTGADSADRLGPPRAAASGLLTERELLGGIAVILAATGVVGLGLVAVGGAIILVLGLLAAAAALAYTGGPWPYGYHGLGEVFVFMFFGVVAVAGTTYLQTGAWEGLALVASVPVGVIVTAILTVNNLRDIDTDRAAGKRTLATRIGRRGAGLEFAGLLAVAYTVPPAMVVGGLSGPPVLLPLISLPLSVRLIRVALAAGDPRRLNGVLRGTARLALGFSVLFAIGLAAGGSPG